jgi:hypothetical protein
LNYGVWWGAAVGGGLFLLLLTTVPKLRRWSKYLTNGTPALLLTPEGLVNNLDGYTYPWTSIKDIAIRSTNTGRQRVRYIAIALFEPEPYIEAERNPWDRFIMRMNVKATGGPYTLSTGSISGKRSQILQELNDFLKAYGTTPP